VTGLGEQPLGLGVVTLYSWEKDNSDLFIKYASEWLNNFIGEYFPDIRIASEGLSSVINAVDLGRINVILERFERIEINRNGRGLNSIIDNFVLEDCEKNVRLEYRLANNYRDDIHSLFRTHFSNFKLSGDYIVKLNNFSIIGVEGR
jgi:hypothetical protein